MSREVNVNVNLLPEIYEWLEMLAKIKGKKVDQILNIYLQQELAKYRAAWEDASLYYGENRVGIGIILSSIAREYVNMHVSSEEERRKYMDILEKFAEYVDEAFSKLGTIKTQQVRKEEVLEEFTKHLEQRNIKKSTIKVKRRFVNAFLKFLEEKGYRIVRTTVHEDRG